MSNENEQRRQKDGPKPIPEEVQQITTEEIVEGDYEVLSRPEDDSDGPPDRGGGPPVRPPFSGTYLDNSVESSSEGRDRTEEGYSFTAGYDSSMATRIGDETADGSEAARLRKLHEGRHRSDGEHSIRESQRDKKRIPQAICSGLPLASHEKDMVVSTVQELDFSRFGQHKNIAKVTLGVVAVLVDERVREPESMDEVVSRSDSFKSLRESHEVSMSDLSTIKSNVREAIDDGDAYIRYDDEPLNRDPALPSPTSVGERPDEFWEDKSAEYWTELAKHWGETPSEAEEIPQEYRDRIEQLQKWSPWEDGEEEELPDNATTGSTTSEVNLEEVEEMINEEVTEKHE